MPCDGKSEYTELSEYSEARHAMPTAVPCYEHDPAVDNERPRRTLSTPPPSSAFRGRMVVRRGDRHTSQGGEEWEKQALGSATRTPECNFSLHKISVEKFGHLAEREPPAIKGILTERHKDKATQCDALTRRILSAIGTRASTAPFACRCGIDINPTRT